MSSNSMIKNTGPTHEEKRSIDPVAEIVLSRMVTLFSETVQYWKENSSLKEIAALTDRKIVEMFYETSVLVKPVDEQEERDRRSRVAARAKFNEFLGSNGGLLRARDICEIANVSRQTVSNWRDAGKLIAWKRGEEYEYPGFQFHKNKRLEYLDVLLSVLNDTDPESKCLFFLYPIENANNELETPVEILKRGCTDEGLQLLKREASIYRSSEQP
ncbi:hypothetical protein ACFQDN_22550 [Pseudomonas asuensis]|uniref:Helix-turn-helix domain-containing protein n=1 Tax=Pseudomonas asuensis TaxID=1825787 RepID=A0ABQ2H5Z1_9PSED|nr:helix-turn-helix domain-containing protein [Pseudomonas asuensis]GGM32445.1 hypothetical protein GCM10009425_48670 [Pseudomonas asuensis]